MEPGRAGETRQVSGTVQGSCTEGVLREEGRDGTGRAVQTQSWAFTAWGCGLEETGRRQSRH